MKIKVKHLKVGDTVYFVDRQVGEDGISGCVNLSDIKEEGKHRVLIFEGKSKHSIRLSKESEVDKSEGFEKFQKKRTKRKHDGKRVYQ